MADPFASTDARIACRRPPVIIMGMHRSGTTLVARCLRDTGLFLGADLQTEYESCFFISINEEVFRRANAGWDHPSPVGSLVAHDETFRMTLAALRTDLVSAPIRRYLGLRRYFRHRSLSALDEPWGWKDPRNVFTLPLWLALFPEAKIIYVVRNGIDVAASLTRRAVDWLALAQRRAARRLQRWSARTALSRAGYHGSARCLTLEGSFSLWEEYLAFADALLAKIKNERLVVKYEELLGDTRRQVSHLTSFCGLDAPTAEQMARLLGAIDSSRAYAFESSPDLRAYYARVRNQRWMRHYGYAEIGVAVKDGAVQSGAG